MAEQVQDAQVNTDVPMQQRTTYGRMKPLSEEESARRFPNGFYLKEKQRARKDGSIHVSFFRVPKSEPRRRLEAEARGSLFQKIAGMSTEQLNELEKRCDEILQRAV